MNTICIAAGQCADDAGEIAREGVPSNGHVGGGNLVDADEEGHQRHEHAPRERRAEHAQAGSAHERTAFPGFPGPAISPCGQDTLCRIMHWVKPERKLPSLGPLTKPDRGLQCNMLIFSLCRRQIPIIG